MELETPDEHLDFPFLYASGRDGWVQREPGGEQLGLDELMRFIVEHVPEPEIIECDHVAVRVTAIEYSDYLGKMGIGRVQEGILTKNMRVRVLPQEGEDYRDETVRNLFRYRGIEKVEVDSVSAGDIVAIAGLKAVDPGDTVTTKEPAEKLEPVPMDEPTISMEFSINTSPFAGKEGEYVTATKIGERLFKELERNVALKVENTASPDTWMVSGRGLLHLSILIENMRREGYEFAVSRPQVVTRDVGGVINEPYQAIYIETPEACNGKIIELMSTNCAELKHMNSKSGSTMLEFLIPARGMIGMRSKLMTVSKGEAIVNSMFDSWQPMTAKVPARSTGSLVSLEQGEATAYSLAGSEERGRLFIGPGEKVYPGMVVGENAKERDLGLNVVKGKKLTNVRASGSDKNIKLTPPTCFSLEENLEFLAQDEMLEVTLSLSDCAKLFWTNRSAVSLKEPKFNMSNRVLSIFCTFLGVFFSQRWLMRFNMSQLLRCGPIIWGLLWGKLMLLDLYLGFIVITIVLRELCYWSLSWSLSFLVLCCILGNGVSLLAVAIVLYRKVSN